jgi:hypothetical protein
LNSGIAVDHDYYDLYAQGSGGTGVNLGSPSVTAPLQGFTFNRLSCTGIENCVIAQTAGNGAGDQLIISDAQINAHVFGVKVSGWNTVNINSSYFLDNGTAVYVTGSSRTQVVNNTFYLGPPTSAPGNGTNNLAVVLNNVNGGPDGGSIVSSNLITNNYGATPAITLSGFSNYVHVVSNMALQGPILSDTTGNPNNTNFGNYDTGGIHTISLTPQTTGAKINLYGNATTIGGYGFAINDGELDAFTNQDFTVRSSTTVPGLTGPVIFKVNTKGALLPILTVSTLPANCTPGTQVYVSNARKNNDAAGAGTGNMAFCDNNHTWMAAPTVAAVTQ